MKKTLIISILSLTAFTFSACEFSNPFSDKNEESTEKISRMDESESSNKNQKVRRNIQKELTEDQVFIIDESEINISFEKIGFAEALKTVNVSAQVAGEIEEINTIIGEEVEEGTILATLGNSLGILSNEIQLDSARNNLKIAEENRSLTQESNQNNQNSANISVDLAREAYQNAIDNERNSEELYEEQLDSANIQLSNARLTLEQAENGTDLARDSYEDAKDNYEDAKDLADEDPTINLSQLKAARDAAESQYDNAKLSEQQAENAVKSAREAIDQIEKNFDSQEDQLAFAIDSAYLQYQSAINQANGLSTTAEQQLNAIDSQIIQAESSYNSAKISDEFKNIKSPIDGKISAIDFKKGNQVSPGQTIFTIENTDSLIIKTSVNEDEIEFLRVGNPVKIISGNKEFDGNIYTIQPNINPQTKKFDLEVIMNNDQEIENGAIVDVKFLPNSGNKDFIPLNSIVVIDGKKYVKVINKFNQVRLREVQTGTLIGKFIEVTNQLNNDEPIILATTTFLNEGDDVIISKK